MLNEMLSVYFWSTCIFLKGFGPLEEPKRAFQVSLDSHNLWTPQPATCSRIAGGRRVCTFAGAVIWRIRLPALQPSQVRGPGEISRRSRAGARWRRRSAAVLCRLAFRCPRVVVFWVLPLGPHSGSPVLLLQALPSPCPGPARRRPYPLTPLCTQCPSKVPGGVNPGVSAHGRGRAVSVQAVEEGKAQPAQSAGSGPASASRATSASPCGVGRRRQALRLVPSQAAAAAAAMAEVHRRQHARVKGEAPAKSSTHRHEEELGMASAETLTVFLKLLAAGFYGVSSFLIVVVNKSVLTNYR